MFQQRLLVPGLCVPVTLGGKSVSLSCKYSRSAHQLLGQTCPGRPTSQSTVEPRSLVEASLYHFSLLTHT